MLDYNKRFEEVLSSQIPDYLDKLSMEDINYLWSLFDDVRNWMVAEQQVWQVGSNSDFSSSINDNATRRLAAQEMFENEVARLIYLDNKYGSGYPGYGSR